MSSHKLEIGDVVDAVMMLQFVSGIYLIGGGFYWKICWNCDDFGGFDFSIPFG